MKNVIVDTDIGFDADDAFALGLALKSPEVRIRLIITNDEFKGNRVRVLDRFLKESGYSNVPIVKGFDLGNENFVAGNFIKQFEIKEYGDNFVQAIKDVVENNDKVYYVCLSTFTNLAKFLSSFISFTNKIEVVSMAGSKENVEPEHNLRLDVNSARKVIDLGAIINLVTADITRNKQIELHPNSNIIQQLKNSKEGLHKCIYQLTKLWFKNKVPTTYMHDPLTLSYLIHNKFLSFKKEKITFTDNGYYTTGNGSEIRLCVSADYQGFMEFLKKRLFSSN